MGRSKEEDLRLELKEFHEKSISVKVRGTVERSTDREGTTYVLLRNVTVDERFSYEHMWVRYSRNMEEDFKHGKNFVAMSRVREYLGCSLNRRYGLSKLKHIDSPDLDKYLEQSTATYNRRMKAKC